MFNLSNHLSVTNSLLIRCSEFLHNFFKPIANDVENLKSYKKHKHGRRIRQLEKYEQKMKEERQRRIRERQKEFFGEIEVHKYVQLVFHLKPYFSLDLFCEPRRTLVY